jgi:eukaryotic-like serine/threonine-protein kinase
MSFAPGAHFGPYEIVAAIGAGGMGEVYRAHDSRLNRHVAIKILPQLFAADADRIMRFQREAQVLASLNHPNIAHIHGVEEVGGVRALVLEFVEGPTLEELIAGGLSLAEGLQMARQIAEALEAAHEAGVIHRDLKPANIKVTPGGVVKVLDFGLAKPSGADQSSSSLSMSPTITSPAMGTHAGVILGTAAYMSPEQARGKPVDKRADIWAFGAVLFEMLSGRQLYAGDTITDVLAGIVTREPDWRMLPTGTPRAVRRLLARCLEKDPKQRLRDIGEARIALTAPDDEPKQPVQGSRSTSWIVGGALAAAAIAALVTAGLSRLYRPAPVPSAPEVRFEIPVLGTPTQAFTVSPDGNHVAFVADNGGGQYVVWLRSLDAMDARILAGTEGTPPREFQFWSPDSRHLVFAQGGRLKKVDITGGLPETITDVVPGFSGGAWSRTGAILIATNGHGLRRFSSSDGALTDVTKLDLAQGDTYHDCPFFLPDGHHFVYLAYREKKLESSTLYLGDLNSNVSTPLMNADFCAAYVPGAIVFPRGTALMARPFSEERLAFSGDAVTVVQNLALLPSGEVGLFATASDAGALAYRTARVVTSRLVWTERTGRSRPSMGPPLAATQISLSPDGTKVAFSEGTDRPQDDIWVYDIGRDVKSKLTTDPAIDHFPTWSPDGSRLAFDSHRDGIALYEMPASGAVPEHQILAAEPAMQQSARSWSADDRFLLFQKSKGVSWDIWVLPLSGDRKPFPYVATPASETDPVFSRNGKWVAYDSTESGKLQVVVQPFPDPSAGKWQISTQGGAFPRWRGDGKELYYLAPSGELKAVAVTTEPTFAIGKTTTLFQTSLGYTGTPQGPRYDVTADGQRFLVLTPDAGVGSAPITVILNGWNTLLKR